MKMSSIRRLEAVIISILLLTLPLTGLIASATEANEKYPLISVPGIMHADIHTDANNPDSEVVWPPSTDSILDLVEDCIPALTEFSVTGDWNTLGDKISPLAYSFFESSLSDPDGKITNGSGVCFEYPDKESLDINPDSVFKYDWRADPIDTAANLDSYINYILENTGAEKVALSCHSLGGIIVLSYLSLYGYDKVDAIAFNTTAIYGASYVGNLLSGDIEISNESLFAFLDFVTEGTANKDLLNRIFDMLECAGLGKLVENLGTTILAELSDKLLPEVVIPLFGKWLTIWALVPDEKIDEAMKYTFENFIPEDAEGRDELRANIENYNTLVRKNKSETLRLADEHCKIGVISRYGFSSIPATSQWQFISDGVLDSSSTSFGATFALYGATLSEDVINSTSPEYISPDKTVDASTCLFPDKTWFIRNGKHNNGYQDLTTLINTILYDNAELTVNTYAEFPRFMVYDFESDSLIPDSGKETSGKPGFLAFVEKIKAFIADFFKKFRILFGIE